MKIKIHFENEDSTMGGFETISIFTFFLWILLGRINPKEKSAIYFIRKIEKINGNRI